MVAVQLTIANPRYSIAHAAGVLKNGGVIAYPTETAYGLGCDPRNAKAVQEIYRLKGRDRSKPLLLVAASLDQVKRVANMDAHALSLAKTYWPGPLTLILPVKKPSVLVPGVAANGHVAIRVSSSPVVQMLTREFGFPVVSTSANKSGQPEARSVRAIRDIFGAKIHFMLDGGALPKRKLSTVARVKPDGSIDVIRSGAIRL